MNDASIKMMDSLESATKSEGDVDLKDLFGSYTMDVISRCAFATESTPNFVVQASQLFTFPFWRKFLDYVIPMYTLNPLKFTLLPRYPMEFFRKVTISAIRERRENADAPHPQDFLNVLMKAECPTEVKAPISSKMLTEEEILAQSVLFFSVGFETSSQLLTYASYCLALNPHCQERAHAEISQALENAEAEDVSEVLKKLPYLNAVIDEALRLYNPVLRMERRAASDFVLGDTSLVIPKGMIVGIPVWALHHSEEYYPEPFKFEPERFLPENKGKIVPSTHLPLGDGPRSCIGVRFALMECRIGLAKILIKYKFVPSPNTKVPLEFFPTGRPLLGPKQVVVRIQKRI